MRFIDVAPGRRPIGVAQAALNNACLTMRSPWPGTSAVAGADGFDVDAVVVEDCAAPHVGVAFVDGGVDVAAAAVELGPMALGGAGDARPDAVADLCRGGERPPVVEHPDGFPVADPPGTGAVGWGTTRGWPCRFLGRA